MGRWIENQQEYINALQKDLDKARRAGRILKALWPCVECSNEWHDSKYGFTVKLSIGSSVITGGHDHEHDAWLAAWEFLKRNGVLKADVILELIQKMDGDPK